MSNKIPLDYQLNTPMDIDRSNLSKLLIDPLLVLSLLIILGFGLFILFSASGQSINMVIRQAIYIGLGLISMLLISRLDQSVYKNLLMHLFWVGLILLFWVLMFPAEGYNANRWIDIGFVSFQPSEALRLILPLAAASYLTRNQKGPFAKNWFIVILATLLCSFLIFKQPDLDVALIVMASGCIPVFLSGLPLLILFSFLIVVTAISPYLWLKLSSIFSTTLGL